MKTGNDESQFNASLIVRGKVVRQSPQIKFFGQKGEPNRGIELSWSAYQPN